MRTLASQILHARSLMCAGELGEAGPLLRDVLCAFRRIHGDAHDSSKMLMEVRMKKNKWSFSFWALARRAAFRAVIKRGHAS